MSPLRGMAGPAYLIVAILVVFPALQLVQAIWPMRFDDISWRVTSVGLLSGEILIPLLGLVFAHALALFLEQWRVVKTLAWVNVALAVILVLGLGVYALDARELRADIARDAQRAYDLGIVVSFAKFGLGLLVLAALVYAQRRVLGEVEAKARLAEAERAGRSNVKPEIPPLFFHADGRTHPKAEGEDEGRPDEGQE